MAFKILLESEQLCIIWGLVAHTLCCETSVGSNLHRLVRLQHIHLRRTDEAVHCAGLMQ